MDGVGLRRLGGLVAACGTPGEVVKSKAHSLFWVCIPWVGWITSAFAPVGVEVPIEFLWPFVFFGGMILNMGKIKGLEEFTRD